MDLKPSRMMINPKTMRGCAEVYLRVGDKMHIPCYVYDLDQEKWTCMGDATSEKDVQDWLDAKQDIVMFT